MRWVEMHFPWSEIRIDPRMTTQNNQERKNTNKQKTGPEPNATKTNRPPIAVMRVAKVHHCR